MDFDNLAKLSDLTDEQYQKAKETYLSIGHSGKLMKLLRSRSKLPIVRNLEYPTGEIYLPVYWTNQYMIKYIKKNSWGSELSGEGFEKSILTITIWDLLVLDIDDKNSLPYVKKKIDRYYPSDLFYIHETPRGYHLFLISRKLNHCTGAAIYMRLKLSTDVAHGSNSLYTGTSLRLSRKSHEPDGTLVSSYIDKYGQGEPDPEAIDLYNKVCYWINYFHQPENQKIDKLMTWWNHMPDNFGTVHVRNSAPYNFNNGKLSPNMGFKFNIPQLDQLWSKFIKYKTYKSYELVPLSICAQKQMGYNNLYRIFKAEQDYAIGVHLQHNVHFIAYRDLLYLDYDCPQRIQIVARFVKKHPEYKFRIVKSTKGYHAFLTSHAMMYNDMNSLNLLMDLRSDPAHILGVCHRGYSVRINQKCRKEKPYKEVCTYGKGDECPRLLKLYYKHIELYNQYVKDKTPICQYQKKRSYEIMKKEGILRPF